uniref:Interferon-induced protein 44-like n=1 Tax=Crassostrea virginica TaxID=6565 RepID=A0A8B8AZK9_CRAVI|nr:interferon-induced protein 44-like [Crassostrea virginica]
MAIPLQAEELAAIKQMIGGNVRLNLLYKISRDGCSASTFHTKCDCKGPTITVIYNSKNTVYGGYTSQNWLGTGAEYSAYDEKAFLFQVRYNGTNVQKKYPIKADKLANAISCSHNIGPTFGKGDPEFPSFSGVLKPSNGVFVFKGTKANIVYNITDIASFTNDSLEVQDLEVYKVDEGLVETTVHPWRKTPTWNITYLQNLKREIDVYAPLEVTGVEQVNVLLFGQCGAGKSSFFNSINSIFKGVITSQAPSGSTDKSLTNRFRKYQVRRGRNGSPLSFRLCDTKGLEKNEGLHPDEFSFVLDGHMPDKYLFNASSLFGPESPGYVAMPSIRDKIHIVVIVIDATIVDVYPDEMTVKLKSMQGKVNQRGIPQIVLLTKIDKYCKALQGDVSKIFSAPEIGELVDKVAELTGLPRANIVPIKNYECEMELREDIDILALLALRQILNFADDYLTNFLDD